MPRAHQKDRKICRCNEHCYKILSKRARDRHYENADPTGMLPSESEDGSSSDDGQDEEQLEFNAGDEDAMSLDEDDSDTISEQHSESDVLQFFEDEEGDSTSDLHLSPAEIEAQLEAWLGPERECEFHAIKDQILTDKDRDDIRAFKLKMVSNMPRKVYDQIRHSFRHKITLDSEWVTLCRLALLAGIQPLNIHCCVNSCVAFTRQYIHAEECPVCTEPRYSPSRKPRRQFSYLPLIPRLQAFFQNEAAVDSLLYRHRFVSSPGTITDVFDGEWYKILQNTPVKVDSIPHAHTYFENKYDIALGLSVDSYLLFKRRRGGPSATPLLLQNFNLPPQIRSHLEHLICVGVIPGPHQPKDIESFLAPLDDELAALATGVQTFDVPSQQYFDLRAYVLFKNGDIIAIEKLLNIKGHNSFCPCRSCKIQGVRNISAKGTVYYVPLRTPRVAHQTRPSVDPKFLDLRTHAEYLRTLDKISNPNQTKKHREEIMKQSGIRGPPVLRRVSSVDYARSVPWEWMHLLLENVIPTLVDLWTGRFKGLDTGVENYEIASHIWQQVGEETVKSISNIPSAFVRVLGNIAEDRSTFTAEAWGFWFMYLAPILLKDRFPDDKIYTHMLLLANLMKKMVKFRLTSEEVDEIEEGLTRWVSLYERYYYQYNESRLGACTLPIHGLLHVAAGIRFCGPVWTSWTFSMERFCGMLQAALRSRRSPWSSLNRRILHMAYLTQLKTKYNLEEELAEIGHIRVRGRLGNDQLSRHEHVYAEYPMQAFLGPYHANYQPDNDLRRRVAVYLQVINGGRFDQLIANLPHTMPSWSKLRIRDGGDRIQTEQSFRRFRESRRDNTFVRYEIQFEDAKNTITTIQYGQLVRILVCSLGDERIWRELRNTTLLLALVKPLKTDGNNAALTPMFVSQFLAPTITDIRNIKAVVGRVETGKRWGIIDRSTGLARTSFAPNEADGAEGEPEADDEPWDLDSA